MGGDGGTLNNTRREHVRLRRASGLPGSSAVETTRSAKDCSSVTVCAVSRQPLDPPIVVDRLGQLFNREALIGSLLARGSSREGPLSHIRSLARDTAAVLTPPDECAATKDRVVDAGRFGIGWACGCVVSCSAIAVLNGGEPPFGGVGKRRNVLSESASEGPCIACGKVTSVVKIGLPWHEREEIRTKVLMDMATRALAKKAAKRRKVNVAVATAKKKSAAVSGEGGQRITVEANGHADDVRADDDVDASRDAKDVVVDGKSQAVDRRSRVDDERPSEGAAVAATSE